jgi:hypothetical protein
MSAMWVYHVDKIEFESTRHVLFVPTLIIVVMRLNIHRLVLRSGMYLASFFLKLTDGSKSFPRCRSSLGEGQV